MLKSILSCLFIASYLIGICLGQLGTDILSPADNSTIKPGDKVKIDFEYQNMGSGTYKVDIDVWTDNTLKTLAKNIVKDYAVPAGNSTGTKLAFNLNSTYTWTVPHGLNELVYLTVTTKPEISVVPANYSMRSKGLILHVNAGLINLPMHHLGLLALSLAVLYFMY